MDHLFIQTLFTDPMGYFAWVIIIVFSICVHEFAHAAMAWRMGDDTAARQGHLTLNPLRQMGPRSLLMLALIGLAWGAVPVMPSRLGRGGRALVSFAGPGSNALLCMLFSGAAMAAHALTRGIEGVVYVLLLASSANGVLFILNMLPVPMLDGWPVFALLFPRMREISPQQVQTLSWVFLLVIFFTPLWSLIWTGGSLMAAYFMQSWLRLFSLFL